MNPGSKNGIDPKKFPHLDNFMNEIFIITQGMIEKMGAKYGDYNDFNSIQVNQGCALHGSSPFAPKWHNDNSLLYKNGMKRGIFTLHLQGWNSFVTNQDAFKHFNMNLVKNKPKIAAELVMKYGFVKIPNSGYFIDGFATHEVDHAVINNNTLSWFVEEYNELLKENVSNGVYESFKIGATSNEIRNTLTQSMVIRNIKKRTLH